MNNPDSTGPQETTPLLTRPSRREFLGQLSLLGAGLTLSAALPQPARAGAARLEHQDDEQSMRVAMTINGRPQTLYLDPRVTLLDALRERLQLTGTKKGCDRGQCGACTVLVNGRRVNSCLTLAGMCQGAEVTTIEGLSKGDELHPLQEAFIRHDAFQCGYCTPGQICSAVGLLREGHARTDADIRELMSGNICRCGAYQHILEAIKEVQQA